MNKNIESKLYDRIYKFMIDNSVNCEEVVYQSDHVIENAYSFIADLFEIIERNL